MADTAIRTGGRATGKMLDVAQFWKYFNRNLLIRHNIFIFPMATLATAKLLHAEYCITSFYILYRLTFYNRLHS